MTTGARGSGARAQPEGENAQPPAPDGAVEQVARAKPKPRRDRLVRFSMTLLTVVALLVAGLALVQRSSAVHQRDEASARGRAAALAAASRALLATDPRMALALAAEASLAVPNPPSVALAALVDARVAVGAPSWQALRAAIGSYEGGSAAVAFSPHGTLLAIAGANGRGVGVVRIWDMRTDELVAEVPTGHVGAERGAAFSANGRMVAVGGADGGVRLVDVARGRVSGRPLAGPTGGVRAVGFSPDGAILVAAGVSGDGHGRVQAWDVASRRPLGVPLDSDEPVSCLAFSRGGDLATCGVDQGGEGTVGLWDPRTGRRVGGAMRGHYGPVEAVAFSRDGALMASGGADGTVQVWEVASGDPVGVPLSVDGEQVTDVAFSPDEDLLATAGSDGLVRLWDPVSGDPVGQPLGGPAVELTDLAFSPDGSVLAAATLDGTVQLWERSNGDPIGLPLAGHPLSEPLPEHGGGVVALAFSPDGTLLATGGVDEDGGQGVVQLWDAATGAAVHEHVDVVSRSGPAFSPDGALLATAGRVVNHEGSVELRRVATGELAGEVVAGFEGAVTSVVLSPDGARIAVATWDDESSAGSLAVWDVPSRTEVGDPVPVDGRVTGLSYSPDGAVLAGLVRDTQAVEAVRLWAAAGGAPLGVAIARDGGGQTALAFRAQDGRLATGGADGSVRIWDTSSGTEAGPPMEGGEEPVTGVAFSPDGTLVAATSVDGTLRLWDAASSAPLGQFDAGGPLAAVAFAPSGDLLATAGADGTVRLWDAWRGDAACDLIRPYLAEDEVARGARLAWPGSGASRPACWAR